MRWFWVAGVVISTVFADLLQRMIGRLFTQFGKMWNTAFILIDPFIGKFAGLNVLENLLHRLAYLGSDNSFPPG